MSLTKFITKELRKSRRLRGNLKGGAVKKERKKRVSSRETVGKDQMVEMRPIAADETTPQPYSIRGPDDLLGQIYSNASHKILLDFEYPRKIPRNIRSLIYGPKAFGFDATKTENPRPTKRPTPALDADAELRLGMRMLVAQEMIAAEELAKEAERLEELERTNAAIRLEFQRQAELRRLEEISARQVLVKPEPISQPQIIPLSDPTLGDRIHQARVNQQQNRAFNNAQAAPPPATFPSVEYTTPMQEKDAVEKSKPGTLPGVPAPTQKDDDLEDDGMEDDGTEDDGMEESKTEPFRAKTPEPMQTGEDPLPTAPFPPTMPQAPRAYRPVRDNINTHVRSPQEIIQPKMTEGQALLPQLLESTRNLQGGTVRGDAVLQNYVPTQEGPPGYLPALQHMENYRDPYFIMNKESANGIRRLPV